MKIKTSELQGAALDWAVGSCMNPNLNSEWPYGKITWSPLWKCYTIPDENNAALRCNWHPSTNWAQGGPIIERGRLNLCPTSIGWEAAQPAVKRLRAAAPDWYFYAIPWRS